jgi:transposase-like protein
MGATKGGTKRYYSRDFKMEIIQEVAEGKGASAVARERNINRSIVKRWVHEYAQEGEDALTPKRRPGNPLAMYSRRKSLNEVEQLRYELALACKEIAQLKKDRYEEWRDAQKKK